LDQLFPENWREIDHLSNCDDGSELKIPTTGNKVDERMSIWEIVTENQDCENV
jgi:hypothetical protein